jgi:DNA-directed RNA polymerase II subunit RPB1
MRKYNNLESVTNLTSWVIYIELDIEVLFSKNITMESVVNELRQYNSDMYVVRSAELDEQPSIAFYVRSSLFGEKGGSLAAVEAFSDTLLNTTISGIADITSAEVIDFARTYEKPDGSLDTRTVYAIKTSGTNMREILLIDELDQTRCQTNSTHEMYDLFGICVAKRKLETELRGAFDGHSFAHYTTFVNIMTHSGDISGITPSGATQRGSDVLTLASYGRIIPNLMEGALRSHTTYADCPTPAMMLGAPLRGVGVASCSLVIDDDMVSQMHQSVEDLL